MAASGVQILDAQIVTRKDGIVVDTFQVTDPDYQGAPPRNAASRSGQRITEVLTWAPEQIESDDASWGQAQHGAVVSGASATDGGADRQ